MYQLKFSVVLFLYYDLHIFMFSSNLAVIYLSNKNSQRALSSYRSQFTIFIVSRTEQDGFLDFAQLLYCLKNTLVDLITLSFREVLGACSYIIVARPFQFISKVSDCNLQRSLQRNYFM